MTYETIAFMKKIAAAKFKEQCLAIIDQLSKEGLIITKHGKPVARIVPVGFEGSDLIGILKDKIKLKGYILSTGTKWNVQS